MNKERKYMEQQIITYMGNKRKLLPKIQLLLNHVKDKMDKDKLIIGDGFSGSGIVSRLFLTNADELYTNDIAGYSYTLNNCFLKKPDENNIKKLEKHICHINKACLLKKNEDPFIEKHWAPNNDNNIKLNERTYFTNDNAKRIDIIRNYIEQEVEKDLKSYLLASLLVESSIHNNTNGQFSAFYKNKDNIGQYGGEKNIDTNRITQSITLKMPIWCDIPNVTKQVFISQQDTNKWITELPIVDVMYYDPPYNKHPYNIYYFLLDIINDWNKKIVIPDTYRGQPKTWIQSSYNSVKKAKDALEDLLNNTRARYIILSYFDKGIIPLDEFDVICAKHGLVYKIPVEHKTYNRLKSIANYKRLGKYENVNEYMWLIEMKLYAN